MTGAGGERQRIDAIDSAGAETWSAWNSEEPMGSGRCEKAAVKFSLCLEVRGEGDVAGGESLVLET